MRYYSNSQFLISFKSPCKKFELRLAGPTTVCDEIFTPVIKKPAYFNLINDAPGLANKQIIMIDEHSRNKQIADFIQKANHASFEYQVWQTDHPFANKRILLINKVISFLDK